MGRKIDAIGQGEVDMGEVREDAVREGVPKEVEDSSEVV